VEQLTLVEVLQGGPEGVQLPEPTRQELVRVMAQLILASVAGEAAAPGTGEEVRGDE